MNTQPEMGYQLEPTHYFSAEWYEREQAQLFSKNWTFAGFSHELKEPGDYVVVQVGHYPMLVTRDNGNNLNALHNVCRHRGIKIRDDCGKSKALICPYHSWRYALDGRLENIPQAETQFPLIKIEDWNLHRGSVAEWNGIIFVHSSPDAPGLSCWLGGLGERLKRFQTEDLVELGNHNYEMAANWKFYIENHVDWLHLYFLHSQTLSEFEHDQGEITQHGPHWTSFEKPKEDSAEKVRAKKEKMHELTGLEPQDMHLGAHLIFPNMALFTSPNTFTSVYARPTGPETCRVELRILGVNGSDTAALNADEFTDVMREDRKAAEMLQLAVRSPNYAVGPMAMNWEAPIAHFHKHYKAAMQLDQG